MAVRRKTERLHTGNARVDAAGRLQLLSWTVKVVSGPDTGTTRALAGPMVVGSGEAANLKLTDSAVSNEHVELEPRADGVFVKDLGSTNGTLLAVSVVAEDQEVDGPLELEGFVAVSTPMRRVFGLVDRLARTETAVLFVGEPGTGKEGLARALHARSERRRGPFVVVDCRAQAPDLVERALFGQPGAFAEAEGGTLFLDEVGELPLELQPRLLRALEAQQVKRAGEEQPQRIDVRLVASTSRPLEPEVKSGRFRNDLYLRLAVAALRLQPLRERREDIPTLVRAMLKQLGRESFELSTGLLATLASFDWPGNVRELRNVVARAVVSEEVSLDNVLNPPAAPKRPQLEVPFKEAKERLVETFTREYLVALSAHHDGNVTQMAKSSGLARTYLHDLLSKYGLARPKAEDPKLED